ncbi:hypothetical protein [Nocardia sp. CC227C]|uniref:hypothetical protein n=1 Tax=Nocardia sp. CC227C TaxID=3044562 RepID=UPI00278C4444|nr:hypothetical protein [Nocardia sp. CC227C]
MEPPRLSGTRPFTGWFLEHLLARPQGNDMDSPIVIAVGPRGTGKTALLSEIRYRCREIPYVYVDFEHREAEPSEVLGELAFGLSRHRSQFGRLAFPRLWLCLLVVGSSIHTDADDRRRALDGLRQVVAGSPSIERNLGTITQLVEFAGEVASGGSGLPPWASSASGWLLRGLGWFDRRRLLRNIGRLPAIEGGAEDALIDLARWSHGEGEAERSEVDTIFCEAFLSDLRHAYTGLNRSRRTLNCVVLLDNVHTATGRKFLSALERTRYRSDAESDPMVVFATSRAWLPRWSEGWHHPGSQLSHGPRHPPTHRTGGLHMPAPRMLTDIATDWQEHSESALCPWSPWYLVDLGRLAPEQIADVAAARGLRPDATLVGFVHRLTDGHPGGAIDVLGAASNSGYREQPTRLRQVLTLRVPPAHTDSEQPPPTVLEQAREQLLRDFDPAAERRDLVTASAAHTIDMLYEPELLDSARPDAAALVEKLRNLLWIREQAGAGFRVNPWLRRILLTELSSRAADDPRDWVGTHSICRDSLERRDRAAEARYHDLALENVPAVVAYLRRPFDAPGTEFDVAAATAWLADLDLITSAPNRLATDVTPIDQIQRMVGEPHDELGSSLGWLTAALWIANDPLGDPDATLHAMIRSELQHLAIGRGSGSMVLYERAERYR